MPESPTFYTVEEAAAVLKVPPKVIREAIEGGFLHHVKVSSRITRIHRDDFEDFWRSLKVKKWADVEQMPLVVVK
jgi:excisionase family DNA binding protein